MGKTIQPGDTVRYLSAVGGGTVTRVDGRMAYVDDNGFETPVLVSDLVVVMAAGHQKEAMAANLMFDQSVRDVQEKRRKEKEVPAAGAEPAPEEPVVETVHGDLLTLVLAFEPSQTRDLSKASFNAVLVNDSNYFLSFSFARRGNDDREWTQVFTGTVAPNELMDLAQYSHETLQQIERVSLQAFAYKKDKGYEMKPVVNITRRLDLTKFHKLHCFRPGVYFDNPVLELPLLKDDVEPRRTITDTDRREDAALKLAEKYKVTGGPERKPRKKKNPEANPTALLPLIEVDLHIAELTDTTAGMSNSDMLGMQLDAVRSTMKKHARRTGQKIVFIHGKGDGVLRRAVLDLLKKEYPKAGTQDASFREYGFGATLVTVH